MPRPRKRKYVCALPKRQLFGPLGGGGANRKVLTMTVDEYEAIRLIDSEGLNQEDCAKQMDVARTTVQRIYNEARKKLAASLVDGVVLKIEGGDYRICDRQNVMPGCGRCCRYRGIEPENSTEKRPEERDE